MSLVKNVVSYDFINCFNGMIEEDLRSKDMDAKYSIRKNIDTMLYAMVDLDPSVDVYCTCTELVRELHNSATKCLPLYGFNGDIKTLHPEAQQLINKGIAYVLGDSHLALTEVFAANLVRVDLKESYRKTQLEYNQMIANLPKN